ncbi:DUF6731 family protein [Clostridium saccharoperbutylacetonicum]|uniref:DUF6731 family protein n=1 Tax=Clostridium saccharoperbutylacetonicum TaxID=36745 RepID=UPI0039E775AB
MAKKVFKVHYFFPVRKNNEGKEKIVNLKPLMQGLKEMKAEERVIKDGEGNIQLKRIDCNEMTKRWMLCFLRNGTDSPFKSKLNDDTYSAEPLDDDEFVGQECCVIYDETSQIIALQNNRASISFAGLAQFFIKFMNKSLFLSAITYKDKYCEISDDATIEYKSVIIGYTDASKLKEIASGEDEKNIELLGKIANDMSAINGKLELSVGRTKNYLGKYQLKQLVNFFKRNKEITNNLKVKMVDNDTVRLIDLLNNKANDQVEITVTKSDPKTFDKILNAMDSIFDVALVETFDKCNIFVNS